MIPGDLYDTENDYFYDNEQIAYFINNATMIADVFYVRGNAEQKSILLPYRLYNNQNEHFHLLCEANTDGIYNYINTEEVNIAGIELPSSFYELDEKEKTKFLLQQYKLYLKDLSSTCGNNCFNVLLCHDPIIIDVMQKFNSPLNFNLIISGHNHGGMWPKWMKIIFKVSGTKMDLCYPTYTKGRVEGHHDENLIISEGITKFHSDCGLLQVLERFHEGTIENVKLLSKRLK